MQRIRLKWSLWFLLASKTLMANLFHVPLKERKQWCCFASWASFITICATFKRQWRKKSFWNLLSAPAWGSKGAAQHFPTPVTAEHSQGERARGVPGLPVPMLLPPLAAGGSRAQEGYRETAMLGIGSQEKSQVLGTGSPGKEPGLFLAGEVVLASGAVLCVLARNQSVTEQQLYLRQNTPLFLPFLRHPFLLGAQCQGVPQWQNTLA